MRTSADDRRAVEAIERACAAAATSDDLLAELSSEMRRIVPHDGAMWFGVDPVTLLGAAPSRVEALDPGLCDTFWHLEFHEQDVGRFVDLARGESATAMRLALDDGVGRSPRYRDFLQPQGYRDELRGVLRSGDSVWGMVGLYRQDPSRPFSPEEVALVKAISRPVGDALRAHVRQSSPWLGQPSAPGLVIVDRYGRVVSANGEAPGWLHELWPFLPDLADVGAGSADLLLESKQHEVLTPLYALVSRARAVAAGRERAPARLRLRDARGRWVVLHASSLAEPGAPTGDAVAIVIEAAKSADVAPIVIDAYSLTNRERDVLGAIARGASTAEIAAELFLSPHTVRDHIKTVFEKVGVCSRGELVAKLFGEHYADPFHDTMVHAH